MPKEVLNSIASLIEAVDALKGCLQRASAECANLEDELWRFPRVVSGYDQERKVEDALCELWEFVENALEGIAPHTSNLDAPEGIAADVAALPVIIGNGIF